MRTLEGARLGAASGEQGACAGFRLEQSALAGTGAGFGAPGAGPQGAGPRRLQRRGPGQGAPRAAAASECDAVRPDGRAGGRDRWAGATAALQRCDSGRGPAGASALRGRGGR